MAQLETEPFKNDLVHGPTKKMEVFRFARFSQFFESQAAGVDCKKAEKSFSQIRECLDLVACFPPSPPPPQNLEAGTGAGTGAGAGDALGNNAICYVWEAEQAQSAVAYSCQSTLRNHRIVTANRPTSSQPRFGESPTIPHASAAR